MSFNEDGIVHVRCRHRDAIVEDFKVHSLKITRHAIQRAQERGIPIDALHQLSGRHGSGCGKITRGSGTANVVTAIHVRRADAEINARLRKRERHNRFSAEYHREHLLEAQLEREQRVARLLQSHGYKRELLDHMRKLKRP